MVWWDRGRACEDTSGRRTVRTHGARETVHPTVCKSYEVHKITGLVRTHRTLRTALSCRTHSTQSLSARFGHGALCLASRISAVEMAWSQAALVRCSAHDPVQYCCTFTLTAILRRSGESSWQPGNSVPRAHVKLKSGLPRDKSLLQSIRRSVEYRYPD
jgi:hypothetical protein